MKMMTMIQMAVSLINKALKIKIKVMSNLDLMKRMTMIQMEVHLINKTLKIKIKGGIIVNDDTVNHK